MSTIANTEEQQPRLLFANFNQDNSSLAAGSKSGFRLFPLNSLDKLEPIYESGDDDAFIVERLFSSSLVAIVTHAHPRKLKVCHFKKGTEICNYSYSSAILACSLNRQRLVVCLEESLYVHNIRDMKVLHTIRETPSNPCGLIALSTCNDNCYLAFPGSNMTGEVQIFDTVNLRAVIMFSAHDGRLAALTFSPAGDQIATASEKGTVIRVFSIPDGVKQFEFRRGVKRCVSISCLSFSHDAVFLCSSSNTETVHVFKLEQQKERPAEESGTWLGMLENVVKSSTSVLPAQMTDMFTQGRSFACARLPMKGTRTMCAISTLHKVPRLFVVNLEGYLYIYNVDPNEAGECQLVREYRIDGSSPDSPTQQRSTETLDRPLTQPNSSESTADNNRGTSPSQPADSLSTSPTQPESQPYREIQSETGGGEDAGKAGMTHLRLEDDIDFPPMMMHINK